jgi:dTDP-glucose 4,6-dehydratase
LIRLAETIEEQANPEAARDILRLTERPETLLRHVQDRSGHGKRYALDDSKVRTGLIGKRVIPFATGLRHVVEWYRRRAEWWQEILCGEDRDVYQRQYGTRRN